MTAQPQPAEQPDDLMAIADAVGVTRTPPKPIHPVFEQFLNDTTLDAVVSAWARAYARPACGRCDETGVVEARCWYTGADLTIVCPDCNGDGGDVR